VAHQFGKNNFVRQNEVGFKGDSRLKNQKNQRQKELVLIQTKQKKNLKIGKKKVGSTKISTFCFSKTRAIF
jgi:hypothetical protein